MARIFLSFHQHDAPLASSLADALAKRGHDIVRFDQTFSVGQKWEEHLRSELAEADAIVIVLTAESRQSQWVMHEAGMAIGYARERGRPLVLPVVFGEIEIPGPLASIQAVISRDLDVDFAVEQLDRVLQRQVGRLRAREQEQREVAKRVEQTASEYIRRSRAELDKRESRYRGAAYLWYSLAFISLAAGAGFATWRALYVVAASEWIQLVELVALGLVVVGLLVGLSKLAYSLGKAFMVEALRNADRSHAISFGEFYLNAFGERAAWAEVKEAFQHWNVDTGSSFATQESKEYDPQLIQLVTELLKTTRQEEKK